MGRLGGLGGWWAISGPGAGCAAAWACKVDSMLPMRADRVERVATSTCSVLPMLGPTMLIAMPPPEPAEETVFVTVVVPRVQKLVVGVTVVDVATEVSTIADCASFVLPEADGDWEDIVHLRPVGLMCLFPDLAQSLLCYRFGMKT